MSRSKRKKRNRRQMPQPFERQVQERPRRAPRVYAKTTEQILHEEFVSCGYSGCPNIVARDLVYCALHRD